MAWQLEDQTTFVGNLLGKHSGSCAIPSRNLLEFAAYYCLGGHLWYPVGISSRKCMYAHINSELCKQCYGSGTSDHGHLCQLSAVWTQWAIRVTAIFSIDEYVQPCSLLHCTIPSDQSPLAYAPTVNWRQPCGGEVYYMHCRSLVRHSGAYVHFLSHLIMFQATSVANIVTLSLPVRIFRSLHLVVVNYYCCSSQAGRMAY
jgi:hypothetical protein